uniref:Uncharacterized protein n=1 Tax=Picea glauca TaxID=3330 RepID=A0A101M3Y2_PICGL|nr:hypothetical protein ABT39_MTgene361 [Picea glauca]QHR86503.1 hypothetical protein Q903MT_gene505 [Picea sitchensis]
MLLTGDMLLTGYTGDVIRRGYHGGYNDLRDWIRNRRIYDPEKFPCYRCFN